MTVRDLRKPFLEALKNWRSSLRKNRGETTTDSAVRLWKSSAKRNSQKESETAKRARTTENKEGAPEEVQAKLNRSPTKVLLLTNVAPAKQPEETIKATVEEWVKKFGSVKECTVVRVPDVPEEDAIRVFVVFDSIKASSKAYASLRGQVTDGRVLRARFYDEKRFQDGELYKARPVATASCADLCTVSHTTTQSLLPKGDSLSHAGADELGSP